MTTAPANADAKPAQYTTRSPYVVASVEPHQVFRRTGGGIGLGQAQHRVRVRIELLGERLEEPLPRRRGHALVARERPRCDGQAVGFAPFRQELPAVLEQIFELAAVTLLLSRLQEPFKHR